jgi:hypothetical protein
LQSRSDVSETTLEREEPHGSGDELRRFLERLKRTADSLEATLRESSRLRRWRDEREAA